MQNELSQEKIDKIMSLYFNEKFQKTEIDTKNDWVGFYLDGEVILGKPVDEEMWYSSGPYFSEGPDIFGMSWPEFHKSMIRYLTKNYPQLKIKRIS